MLGQFTGHPSQYFQFHFHGLHVAFQVLSQEIKEIFQIFCGGIQSRFGNLGKLLNYQFEVEMFVHLFPPAASLGTRQRPGTFLCFAFFLFYETESIKGIQPASM